MTENRSCGRTCAIFGLRSAALTGLAGLVIAGWICGSLLASVGWDATALLRVGRDSRPVVEFVEGELGRTYTVPGHGHDGKFYFVQARDPLLLDPAEYADLIDRPVYRTQRMLYPLLASVGGLLSGWAVVWGLVVVNLLAVALGTWATSRLAVSLGANPWLGLAFVLNPGVIFELIIDGAGALGWALAVLGIWLVVEGEYAGAVAAIVSSVLAREAMMLVALGLAVRMWRSDRGRAIGLVAWPALAAVLWAAWVRFQLGVPLLTSESEEIGLPFVGLVGAVSRWIVEPGWNLLFGATVIVLLLVVVTKAASRPSLVSYSALGFAVLAPFLTRQVWLGYFDITRAVAPAFTTFVLVMFAREGTEEAGRRRRGDEPGTLGSRSL